MSRRRLGANLLSAIVGACVGGAAVLALGSLGPVDPPTPRHARPANLAEPLPSQPQRSSKLLLAWSPGGLGPGAEAALERLPSVRDATTVVAGLDWISSTRAADGTVLDRPAEGYAIPVETAVIEPDEYARFVSPVDRPAVETLKRGDVLFAATEAELRNGAEGTTVVFQDRKAHVAGTVADETANGYEVMMPGPAPAAWQRGDDFVLVHVKKPSARRVVERTLRARLQDGQVLRVRAQGETPFLRYGDAVLPQMLIKKAFGEFAARPLATGSIQIQPEWVKRNIKTAPVPIIGEVTCHKSLFPQLRAALREVVADGLTYAVDPDDYGGCYNARFIDSNPGGRLSHHSWGIAIDINVAENAFGSKPDQDERLVAVMEQAGFTWGGRWLKPDGMHFEWIDWPGVVFGH